MNIKGLFVHSKTKKINKQIFHLMTVKRSKKDANHFAKIARDKKALARVTPLIEAGTLYWEVWIR